MQEKLNQLAELLKADEACPAKLKDHKAHFTYGADANYPLPDCPRCKGTGRIPMQALEPLRAVFFVACDGVDSIDGCRVGIPVASLGKEHWALYWRGCVCQGTGLVLRDWSVLEDSGAMPGMVMKAIWSYLNARYPEPALDNGESWDDWEGNNHPFFGTILLSPDDSDEVTIDILIDVIPKVVKHE